MIREAYLDGRKIPETLVRILLTIFFDRDTPANPTNPFGMRRKDISQVLAKLAAVKPEREECIRNYRREDDMKFRTSTALTAEFSRVGRALVPTYASASTDKFSNRTSIFGISIPTLFHTS